MQRYLPVLLFALIAALFPVVAHAEPIDRERQVITVQTTPPGPVVAQGTAAFGPSGTQASAQSHGPDRPEAVTSGPGVTFAPVPNNLINDTGAPWIDQFGVLHQNPGFPATACPAGQTGFFVFNPQGVNQGVVCVSAQQGGQPVSSPVLQLAQQASASQPWPVLNLGVSPTIGLTGLSSWFWLTGSARMPDATASAGGLTVTVRATLVDVVWDFGDRSAAESGTDLGRPFPAPSGVQHVYQADSRAFAGGYPLNAILRFRVTYSVNGGPFTELGIKARRYTATYVVNQLQPEAVSPR